MIKLISNDSRQANADLLTAMHRGRAAVFGEKLGWDVRIEDGCEIDVFDQENPLYLVAIDDETGRASGSLRLMPTTGRTLLRDVFVDVFDEPVDIMSANIWEATRFCVHPDAPVRRTPTNLHRATCELSLAMCEVGLRAGLTQVIGVFDTRMIRVYRRIGWEPEVIATTDKMAHGRIYVGLWDVTEEALANMRACSGIEGSVIETSDAGSVVPVLAA
ncbi:MAG: GNAT family N-acetyltransferase [Salinarimonadaceae bacterium]|nr:MAG: GNAT family N-acetyltransferase [Salinarimonadaceae bacterium]